MFNKNLNTTLLPIRVHLYRYYITEKIKLGNALM